jgi:hypothetical protein
LRVAGIDTSSFAVDLVTVPLDEHDGAEVEWHSFGLEGADAFDRSRFVPNVLWGRASAHWDGILAVGIEEPTGKFKPGSGFRVQGAVLAQIPERMLVTPWTPSGWRAAVGLPGNCAKEAVFRWVTEQLGGRPASQDAADAYCIALATRKVVLENQTKEAEGALSKT